MFSIVLRGISGASLRSGLAATPPPLRGSDASASPSSLQNKHHSMFADALKQMSAAACGASAPSPNSSRVSSLARTDSLNFLKGSKFGKS